MVPHGLFRLAICATIGHTHRKSSECRSWTRKPLTPGPTNSTCRTSNIFATATSRCSRRFTSRAARGRSRRWSICMAAPGVSPTATPTRSATRCWRDMAWSSSRSTGGRRSEGAYPLALADINYAIRWVKLHAKELKTRPDLVGISGQSSGGHLAMLAAMRPQRSALHDHSAAGRLAGARRHGESGRDVVAGDQSARPLSASPSARARCPIRRPGRRESSTSTSSSGAARRT